MNILKACASAILFSVLHWGLISCNQSSPAAETATAPPVPADTTAQPLAPLPKPAVDTTDISQLLLRTAVADTTLRIDGQLYHLRLRATADSAHMLTAVTSGIVGEAFAADNNFVRNQRVRGPEGVYSITLSEATDGRRVFRREFRKANFYSLVGPDIAVVAEPEIPVFLGYYPHLGGLAFWQSVSIPQSDVGNYLFLILANTRPARSGSGVVVRQCGWVRQRGLYPLSGTQWAGVANLRQIAPPWQSAFVAAETQSQTSIGPLPQRQHPTHYLCLWRAPL
ncbi:hypothetical protein [Hymenobacter norwichensis]|uniref:hypothetical protein n=1 Tax=Hymenobacter norwichensis TaxID=223903 RepID=UPI0003B70C20|nr:hypothetical protein [Hymenobacter norwichensis]